MFSLVFLKCLVFFFKCVVDVSGEVLSNERVVITDSVLLLAMSIQIFSS